MFLRELKTYIDAASDEQEIGVVLYSIKTGEEIAASFAVVANIGEYGELLIGIEVEP